MNTVVNKYLSRYAEPEVACLVDFPRRRWQYCLGIPAFNEQPAFLYRLSQHLASQPCLAILVINRPDDQADSRENQALIRNARDMGKRVWEHQHIALIEPPESNSGLLVVDRTSLLPLPKQQGVGLARKIASDLALALIADGQINFPWIFCSDADVHLPPDYFNGIVDTGAAACLYPFEHLCEDNKLGQATRLYEYSLHHYVDGLRSAGSPCAFHTVGSTLALNAETYAAVRGFPRRAGGEDFYILNKLAKVGRVESLSGPTIKIEARTSARAPFGTGPAVQRILAMAEPETEFSLYNPAIFKQLKCWLDVIPELWRHSERFELLQDDTKAALTFLGVEKAISHSRRHSKSTEGFVRHMHTWFDAFLTLKFVHRLQATTYPAVSYRTIVTD